MATRTITGHLAAAPQVQQAGKAQVTKFRVIENTGQYRDGKWITDETPTTHFVEAWFELGENAAASLHQGDAVIVVGRESSWSSGDSDAKQYGRTITADNIGADLNRAVAQIAKTARDDQD